MSTLFFELILPLFILALILTPFKHLYTLLKFSALNAEKKYKDSINVLSKEKTKED